jgi:hypothetical protein
MWSVVTLDRIKAKGVVQLTYDNQTNCDAEAIALLNRVIRGEMYDV